MKKIAQIGTLLKKIYRIYSGQLLGLLQSKGYSDLRPSFLEVLITICELDTPSIKDIGVQCGLKKQTMTSHLNELESRGYIERKINPYDKREQLVYLTDYGKKFKIDLIDSIASIDAGMILKVGEVELDRIEMILKNFHQKITQNDDRQDQSQLDLFL